MNSSMIHGVALRRILSMGVLIGAATLAACEDDPVDTDGHDEGDVAGFVIERILDSGARTTLYTYAGPTDPDTLFLPHGEAVDIEVIWMDDHGDPVNLPEDEHGWEFTENSSAILSYAASGSEAWQGTITTAPLLPGATVYGGFFVTLNHGEEAEFETPQLVVAVQGD